MHFCRRAEHSAANAQPGRTSMIARAPRGSGPGSLLLRAHGLLLRAGHCAVCLALVVAMPLLGQSPDSGALHGTVLDGQGHPVRGAAITLRSTQQGILRRVRSAENGSFLLPQLSPGDYLLGLPAPAPPRRVTVRLGETEEVEVTLRPVLAGTTVAVRAEGESAPLTAATGRTIPRSEITSIPAEGLRWQDFALLTPGVGPDENADGLVSVHGLDANQNAVLIDGASNTQSYNSVPAGTGSEPDSSPDDDADSAEHSAGSDFGQGRGRRAGAAYGFSLSAVREFRVSTQSYSALSGNAAGGEITTVSRSGSDRFHGSAFFILRTSALAAKNALDVATSYRDGVITSRVVKPHDLRENFGVTLGGPVGRFRAASFFYSYDQQRRGFPAISSPANPKFYALTATEAALLSTRGVVRGADQCGA